MVIDSCVLSQVAFWRFNPAGEVLQYDAFIPNLNPFVELTTGAPISNPTLREVTIAAVCQVTQLRCTGPNTQWESFQQCNQTLHTKDYGNYDEAWGDNIVCRTIHLVLTQVRPEVCILLALLFTFLIPFLDHVVPSLRCVAVGLRLWITSRPLC